MSIFEWLLLAVMIAVALMAGYYQFQMLANSKDGSLSSVWRGAWIFHPELLKEGGQPYRKKLLLCLGILFLLMLIMLTLN